MRDTEIWRADYDQTSLEDAIGQVKGLVACQVVLDADRALNEVHVVGDGQRNAKQIVRDIETLLRARFGISVDYRKISVVQLGDGEVKVTSNRPVLCSVVSRPDQDSLVVSVTLRRDGKEFIGTARGGRTISEQMRLAALATLNAVGQFIPREGTLGLADARLITLAGIDSVAVGLVAWFPTGSERLAGMSVVRRDDYRDGEANEVALTAARATLAALNRRLSLLLSPDGSG